MSVTATLELEGNKKNEDNWRNGANQKFRKLAPETFKFTRMFSVTKFPPVNDVSRCNLPDTRPIISSSQEMPLFVVLHSSESTCFHFDSMRRKIWSNSDDLATFVLRRFPLQIQRPLGWQRLHLIVLHHWWYTAAIINYGNLVESNIRQISSNFSVGRLAALWSKTALLDLTRIFTEIIWN